MTDFFLNTSLQEQEAAAILTVQYLLYPGNEFYHVVNLMTFMRVNNKQKAAGSTESSHFFSRCSFSFHTFHSSDNEVCVCATLKCPWVVLGFKVPGHQTQQPHQQRLLQSGIRQRKNGSYVSEILGAAS